MNLRSTAVSLLLLLCVASSTAVAGESLKHRVRVGSFRVERDVTPGRNRIVGTLTNISHTPVHTAKVRFRLFDAKGHAVGQAVDEVHDLRAGQTWKFHARARGNVSRARLVSVEAR